MNSESPLEVTSKSSFPLRALKTWPGKLTTALLSLLLGWAVSHFVPGVWSSITGALGKSPLEVRVVTVPDRIESARNSPREYLVPHPISDVGPPPSGADPGGRYEWAHSMNGVDAWGSHVELIIRGRSADPVVLLGVDVNVVSRKPPLRGTLLSYDGLGAGIDVRKVYVDLDSEEPRTFHFNEDLKEVEIFPLQVSDTELEVIDLVVSTGSCDCRWTAELDYEVGGREGSIVVDRNGQPFRTVAPANGSRSYHWWRGYWEGPSRMQLGAESRCQPHPTVAEDEPSADCLDLVSSP
jgi:hypothetical protein